MIITRWQAPIPPSQEQIRHILTSEGLEPQCETISKDQRQIEKKHPFGEIRIVAKGELLLTVGGTQLLLRSGDRIDIPANTKHSYSTQNNEAITFFALRSY